MGIDTIIASGFNLLGSLLIFLIQIALLGIILVVITIMFRGLIMGLNFIQSSDSLVKKALNGNKVKFERPNSNLTTGTIKGTLKMVGIASLIGSIAIGSSAGMVFCLLLAIICFLLYMLLSKTVGDDSSIAEFMGKSANSMASATKELYLFAKHNVDNIGRCRTGDDIIDYDEEDYYWSRNRAGDGIDIVGFNEKYNEQEIQEEYRNLGNNQSIFDNDDIQKEYAGDSWDDYSGFEDNGYEDQNIPDYDNHNISNIDNMGSPVNNSGNAYSFEDSDYINPGNVNTFNQGSNIPAPSFSANTEQINQSSKDRDNHKETLGDIAQDILSTVSPLSDDTSGEEDSFDDIKLQDELSWLYNDSDIGDDNSIDTSGTEPFSSVDVNSLDQAKPFDQADPFGPIETKKINAYNFEDGDYTDDVDEYYEGEQTDMTSNNKNTESSKQTSTKKKSKITKTKTSSSEDSNSKKKNKTEGSSTGKIKSGNYDCSNSMRVVNEAYANNADPVGFDVGDFRCASGSNKIQNFGEDELFYFKRREDDKRIFEFYPTIDILNDDISYAEGLYNVRGGHAENKIIKPCLASLTNSGYYEMIQKGEINVIES